MGNAAELELFSTISVVLVVPVVCAVVRASAVLPSVSPMFWRDFVYAATTFQSVVSYGTK